MTRLRYYEEGTPFGNWLRNQDDLPSKSASLGFIASDIDMVCHRWFHHATGKHIQCVMIIEVKTRGARPRFAQMESLSALQIFAGKKNVSIHKSNNEYRQYRFYGVMQLLLSNTSPDDSDNIIWARWPWDRYGSDKLMTDTHLIETAIDAETLKKILRFDLHPISLKPFKPFKSHHGHRLIDQEVVLPLGFSIQERVLRRF